MIVTLDALELNPEEDLAWRYRSPCRLRSGCLDEEEGRPVFVLSGLQR